MNMTTSHNYAPYYREGLLHLPHPTLDLLRMHGLSAHDAERAMHGLALDDDRPIINRISNLIERALESLTEHSSAFYQLNSPETRFMLSDIDANVA